MATDQLALPLARAAREGAPRPPDRADAGAPVEVREPGAPQGATPPEPAAAGLGPRHSPPGRRPPGGHPPPPPPPLPPIQPVPLHEAARSRYLHYALSVITARALPDIRDGLKPVQRRILYGMFHNLHLTHDARFRKSAAVVGDVMAKYHPHGDVAIYDAMVRMAQPFSLRHPLVDGHGNFGSIDGDGAAAMRYTEARLQALAEEMLDELKKETVPHRANYDGTTTEPEVLPSRIPQLLANGSQGIAVGMATNIPPHNLGELCRALVHLVDHPEATVADLVEWVPGPDFPTGGRLLNSSAELRAIYETGAGALRMQGEFVTETADRHRNIVITSIPYGVTKTAIVERIAEHIIERRVPQLVDVRDESTDRVRVVLELKRGEEPDVAMAYLFRHTPLQLNFHVNMTCLVPTEGGLPAPRRVDLREMLRSFLEFRFLVTTRRLEYDLRKLRERIHILEGFARLFDALDEAIALIRASEGKVDAGRRLQQRFALDDLQTEAILELRLYKLARLEIHAIREELDERRAEATRIQALLNDPDACWALIRGELLEIGRLHGDPRRTHIGGEAPAVPEFDPTRYIVRENAWVVLTRGGWWKRQKGISQVSTIRVREGDEVGWLFRSSTTECVVLFTDRGSAYTVPVADIPATAGHGEPVQRQFSFEDGERVVGALCTDPRHLPRPKDGPPPAEGDDEPRPPFAVAMTRGGKCLRFSVAAFAEPSTRAGRRFARLDARCEGDAVVSVELSDGTEPVALASEAGRALLFPVEQVSVLRGPGLGVQALKLEPGDRLLGFTLCRGKRQGLEVETNRGARVIVRETRFPLANRGGKGQEVVKRGRFVRVVAPPVELEADLTEGEDPETDPAGGS